MGIGTVMHTLTLLAATVVTAMPSYAQPGSHDVAVAIPSTIGIRMLGAGTGPRAVDFGYATDATSFLSAVDAGVRLPPAAVNRFDDIDVNVSDLGFWVVGGEATPFAYSGSGSGTGLDLADVRVARGNASGLTQEAITISSFFGRYATAWPLATSPRSIA